MCSLAIFEQRLKEEKAMQITDEEADRVVARVVDIVGTGTGEPSGVTLAPVHTYVHQVEKEPIPWASSTIVIPPFASHWGIIVGAPKNQKLFHLIFVPSIEGEVRNSTVENESIRFHVSKLYKPLPNAKYIGETRYSNDELEQLGEAMIQEFGSYHKVFWNCQTFAKCYLRVITGNRQANFANWTAADTSRLFLCAFLVGAPFASTNKVKENTRTQELVKQIESIPNSLSTQDKSGRAIAAMYAALKQDPSWGSELGKLDDTAGERGFLDRLFKLLFKSN